MELAYLLNKKRYSYQAIADALGRSKSTVWDEVKRNSVGGVYTPDKAHYKAYARKKYDRYQGKKLVEHAALREFVERELLARQSPSAIAGRLRLGVERDAATGEVLPYVSRDTIETYIASPYGRKLEYELAQIRKQEKRRRKKRPASGGLSPRKSIRERPSHIEERQEVGDAEADFIVSGKDGAGYLLTLVSRKVRTGFIRSIFPVTIADMEAAFLDVQAAFPELSSITTDNDLLYRHHERLEALLGVPIYFCDPYSSWQKGTVENYNKQVRRYIPKGTDISGVPQDDIVFVERRLNGRFMGVLGSHTPQEVLERHRGIATPPSPLAIDEKKNSTQTSKKRPR